MHAADNFCFRRIIDYLIKAMRFIDKIKDFSLLDYYLAVFFVISAAALRFIPHWPNFAPIAAMALFGGVYLNKKYALAVPILAMLISDYFIGFYDIKTMASVYLSFILVGLIGLYLKNHKSFINVIGGAFLGSVLFFIITNFAVWYFYNWYPHTLSGLSQCFVLATPFFKNTLAGDFFYVGVMFGAYELAAFWVKSRYFAIKESAL